MKTELFNKDGSKTPARPSYYDNKQEVVLAGVNAMYASNWCEFDANEKQDLIESLNDHWYLHCDEYELAKDFDRDGWRVDRDFIDKLENVTSHIESALRELIKKWGEENDIVQPLSIGTKLDCGVIDGIYDHEPATYTVKMWEEQDNPTTRRLIKWESAVCQ